MIQRIMILSAFMLGLVIIGGAVFCSTVSGEWSMIGIMLVIFSAMAAAELD